MLNHLDYLAGWYAGWTSDRDSLISMELRLGSDTVDKRSAALAVESPTAMGSVIVWESGEIEIEVVDLRSMNRTYADSGLIGGHEDFSSRLSRLVRECLR
jgi:hypothetical protein